MLLPGSAPTKGSITKLPARASQRVGESASQRVGEVGETKWVGAMATYKHPCFRGAMLRSTATCELLNEILGLRPWPQAAKGLRHTPNCWLSLCFPFDPTQEISFPPIAGLETLVEWGSLEGF